MIGPIKEAVGALKLVSLHLDHPTVVGSRTLREACNEAIERLQATLPPCAEDLGRLYQQLLAVTPRGHLPHVTLTTEPSTPYGCVITDASGNVVDRQVGKTVEGLAAMIAARHPAGRGEAAR